MSQRPLTNRPSAPGASRPPSLERWIRRFATRHWFCIGIFATVLFALQIRSWWSPTPDVTGYFSIARSVWAGGGLSNLGNRVLHYAPGYPLLISPAFLFGDQAFLIIALLRFVIVLVTAAAIFFWMRRLIPRPAALLLTLIVIFNVSFWRYYRVALSDLPMMMFLMLGALAARKTLTAPSTRSSLLWALCTAVLLLAGTLTRQTALTLATGFAIAAFFARRERRERFKFVLLTAAILLPALIAAAYVAHHDQSAIRTQKAVTYIDQLQSLKEHFFTQVSTDLHLRISDIGRLLIPGMWNAHGRAGNWLDFNLIIYLPLAVLVALGWFRLARRTNDPLLWSAPFYVLFYILWPFDQDTRFFTPILPILAISLWPLLRCMAQWRFTLLAFLCAAHLGVSITLGIVETRRDGREFRQSWPALKEIALTEAGGKAPPAGQQFAERGLSPNASLWLQYLIDRPIVHVPVTGAEIPGDVQWLAQPASAPVPPGFSAVQSAGPFRVLRKK